MLVYLIDSMCFSEKFKDQMSYTLTHTLTFRSTEMHS